MNVKPQTLGPPLPHEQTGYGRLLRILRDFSTAPLELKLGFGSIWRGVFQLYTDGEAHSFVWTGMPIRFWASLILVVGLLQLWSCLWLKERTRTLSASILAGATTYVFFKYLVNDPVNIAVPLYGPLAVGQAWIALRGWPIFSRKPRDGYNLNAI